MLFEGLKMTRPKVHRGGGGGSMLFPRRARAGGVRLPDLRELTHRGAMTARELCAGLSCQERREADKERRLISLANVNRVDSGE